MTAMISDFSSRAHGKGKQPVRSVGECTSEEIRDLLAVPRLAQTDRPTTAVLMPLLDVLRAHQVWVVAAFLLGTIARDALGDPYAAGRVLQRALDLAESDQVLFPFLSDPSPGLLDRPAPPLGKPTRLREALTNGETRVLHYLPTNLSAREIAHELFLSVNTVKTHQRHLYQKLAARNRTQAVERARALGLLTPSARRPARA
jgi:LuxR family transcriptional regulator, maltose regulon positive regulatory protein